MASNNMNVQFEEPVASSSTRHLVRKQGPIEKFYIWIGIAKNEKSAQIAMLITAVLFFSASVYLIFFRGDSVDQATLEAERTQLLDDINRPIDGRNR